MPEPLSHLCAALAVPMAGSDGSPASNGKQQLLLLNVQADEPGHFIIESWKIRRSSVRAKGRPSRPSVGLAIDLALDGLLIRQLARRVAYAFLRPDLPLALDALALPVMRYARSLPDFSELSAISANSPSIAIASSAWIALNGACETFPKQVFAPHEGGRTKPL